MQATVIDHTGQSQHFFIERPYSHNVNIVWLREKGVSAGVSVGLIYFIDQRFETKSDTDKIFLRDI